MTSPAAFKIDTSRRDLIEVRLVAPDSPAAISAGQYIEQMDVKQD